VLIASKSGNLKIPGTLKVCNSSVQGLLYITFEFDCFYCNRNEPGPTNLRAKRQNLLYNATNKMQTMVICCFTKKILHLLLYILIVKLYAIVFIILLVLSYAILNECADNGRT
jgi:hypothetical protein